jgi:hypothetical protein
VDLCNCVITQRLAVLLQKGNAALILNRTPEAIVQ